MGGGRQAQRVDLAAADHAQLRRPVLACERERVLDRSPGLHARIRHFATTREHQVAPTGHSTPQGFNPVTIVVDEVSGLAPAHRRKIDERKRGYVDLIRETLKQMKDEGRLRDVDPTVAAFSLLGMILWLSRWYRPEGRLSSEHVADEISKIALGGLLRPEARLRGR